MAQWLDKNWHKFDYQKIPKVKAHFFFFFFHEQNKLERKKRNRIRMTITNKGSRQKKKFTFQSNYYNFHILCILFVFNREYLLIIHYFTPIFYVFCLKQRIPFNHSLFTLIFYIICLKQRIPFNHPYRVDFEIRHS